MTIGQICIRIVSECFPKTPLNTKFSAYIYCKTTGLLTSSICGKIQKKVIATECCFDAHLHVQKKLDAQKKNIIYLTLPQTLICFN
jgi:hypothetical protein